MKRRGAYAKHRQAEALILTLERSRFDVHSNPISIYIRIFAIHETMSMRFVKPKGNFQNFEAQSQGR